MRRRREPPPGSEAEVTNLALRAAGGDKVALTEFIAATHDDVWKLLSHLAGPDSADDLTQETYLRVLSALPRFAARSSARTWILSLARRAWIDSLRHDQARPQAAEGGDAEMMRNPPTVDDIGTQTWAEWTDVRALLDRLDTDRREALILTQVLGYTYAEAAHIAGVRVGTIRSRVARARADLVDMTDALDVHTPRAPTG